MRWNLALHQKDYKYKKKKKKGITVSEHSGRNPEAVMSVPPK